MPVKPENVDQYLEIGCGRCELGGTPKCKTQRWLEELRVLRGVLQGSGLTEEMKWSAPCYTSNGKNILMLSALKESVVVSFFRGSQLEDPENILEKPGDNSRFARYIRFKNLQSINERIQAVQSYIRNAIELEQSNNSVHFSKDVAQEHPEELTQLFESTPKFEAAFNALTPGRQRGYLIYFTSAKQSKTRTSRIERSMPKIFLGKGWNER